MLVKTQFEGHVLADEQPSTGECWIPPKKDAPCWRAKEKPQQDGRCGEIAFRIKPHTWQRCLEGSNKTLCPPVPEAPQRLGQTCLWVSEGLLWGTGQQWPAAGAGALATANLGHAACGISPLGGGHRTIKQTHKLQNYYTKETLSLLKKFLGPTTDFPTCGSGKGTENPLGIWLWVWDLTTELLQDWGNRYLEGTNKTLYAPGPRRKEQWPHQRLTPTCLWVSRSSQKRRDWQRPAAGPGALSVTAGASRLEGGCHHAITPTIVCLRPNNREGTQSHPQEKTG